MKEHTDTDRALINVVILPEMATEPAKWRIAGVDIAVGFSPSVLPSYPDVQAAFEHHGVPEQL